MQDKPKLIVITPIRNEEWVLEAFLTHCSSWADKIILSDQHSTDGSKTIVQRFPKATLVDNPDTEMNMAATRRLLFEEADKIVGDMIVFALDADEFLSDGFIHTEGWTRIMNSVPDTIFCFRWTNLEGDYHHIFGASMEPYEWACHFSQETKLAEIYGKLEKSAIHESRIPCTAEAKYIDIDDITFVHLGRLNKRRTANKEMFYQIHSILKGVSPVSIYRSYNTPNPTTTLADDIAITTAEGENIKDLVRTSDNGQHYIDEAIAILHREGTKKFQGLCIWDNPDLQAGGIRFSPPLPIRLVHKYLKTTQKSNNQLVIKTIDHALKRILK